MTRGETNIDAGGFGEKERIDFAELFRGTTIKRRVAQDGVINLQYCSQEVEGRKVRVLSQPGTHRNFQPI